MRQFFINNKRCKTIPANKQQQFPSNRISSAKYTAFNFVWKFGKEQFSNYANVFFLVIAILQQFPSISPTNRYTTIIPLSLVLLLTVIKEIYEDVERRRADSRINANHVLILDGNEFIVKSSGIIRVGDIIMITKNEQVPADVVAISSFDSQTGKCYVETASLDGETNCKEKKCIEITKHLHSAVQLSEHLRGSVECIEPSNDLHHFEGTMELDDIGQIALEHRNLLLRGSVLKKTDWVVGLCIYTGKDCKIARNMPQLCIKQTNIARNTNRIFLCILFLIITMAVTSSALNFWFSHNSRFYRNILYKHVSSSDFLVAFTKNSLTFLILYNNLIPVSLIITCELVKIQHAKFISNNLKLFDDVSDVAAHVHSSNIVEDLGQVSYIFTDKTGTITQNNMVWKHFVTGGKVFPSLVQPKNDETLKGNGCSFSVEKELLCKSELKIEIKNEFEQGIRSCLQLESNTESNLQFHNERFQSSENSSELKEQCTEQNLNSPLIGSENSNLKIVTSSILAEYSATLLKSTLFTENIFCNVEELFIHSLIICNSAIPTEVDSQGKMTYETTCADDFAIMKGCSEMGFYLMERTSKICVIQNPDNSIATYELIKNIDFCYERKRFTVICRRNYCENLLVLTKGADTTVKKFCVKTEENDFSIQKVNEWSLQGLRTIVVSAKCIEMENISDFSNIESLEEGSFLLGAIAIEDKLVDDLSITLNTLTEAGIKIFIVTGDKLETTVAIGKACDLVSPTDCIMIVSKEESIEVQFAAINSSSLSRVIIAIDGEIFDRTESDISFTNLLLETMVKVKSGIFYRFSPLQKSRLVSLLKNYTRKVVLAIGDGANDVGMIQTASVGIGLKGREGCHAARAADISLAKFSMLIDLLLVQGSWCYDRLAKVITYSIYKNTVFYMTQFLFAFLSQFSGQTLFESWIIGLYNVIFTLIPPFTIGLWEKQLTETYLLKYPKFYKDGLMNLHLRWQAVLQCILNSIFHSSVIFGLIYIALRCSCILDSQENDAGLWFVGCIAFSCIIFIVTFKSILLTTNFTIWSVIGIFSSLFFYFPILSIYFILFPAMKIATELSGLLKPFFLCHVFWILLLLLLSGCLLKDFSWKYYKQTYHPSAANIIHEFEQKKEIN